MRVSLGQRPLLYPQPVLMVATYDEEGKPDVMTAAWGGVGDDTQVFLCLSAEHKTTKNILARKAFTVSMANEAMLQACDYVGIVSANDDPDKIAKSGFTFTKAEHVDAPMINELPLCIECTLISYESEHCHLFGEVVNANVDEEFLDDDGALEVEALKPLIFSMADGAYYAMGQKIAPAFVAEPPVKD